LSATCLFSSGDVFAVVPTPVRRYLELSKIMFATYDGIGDFEQDFEAVVEPLGGIIEGWGVKQEVRGLPM